jgi:hypothetical protein
MQTTRNFGIEFELLALLANFGSRAQFCGYLHNLANGNPLFTKARYENWNGSLNYELVNGQWQGATSKDAYRVTNDGSLHPNRDEKGFEIITPLPSSCVGGFKDTASVHELCAMLDTSDFRINRSCGTHVTVETIDQAGRSMTADDIKRFMKLWLVFENTMDTIVSRSRRTNGYCGNVGRSYKSGGYTMKEAFDHIDGQTVSRSVNQRWSRSASRNNFYAPSANLTKVTENRIEFRQHQGTLNANKIERYLELCIMFLDASQNGVEVQPTDWNATPSFQDMITVLEGGNVEYYMTNADGSSQRYHTTWNSVQSGHYTRQGNGVQGSEMSMRGNLWFYYDAQAGRDGMVADEVRRNEAVRFANMAVEEGICEYPYAIQQVTRWRNHRIANPIVTGSADNTALVAYYEERQQQLA